jgi:hypothetical protein
VARFDRCSSGERVSIDPVIHEPALPHRDRPIDAVVLGLQSSIGNAAVSRLLPLVSTSIGGRQAARAPRDATAQSWEPPSQPPETIKIWINAFIPGVVPGVTRPLPGGGGTVVLDPVDGSVAYGTNNRSFSAEIHAPSKMHSEVLLTRDRLGTYQLTRQWSHSDPVAHYTWPGGRLVETRQADTSRCEWRLGGAVADPIAGVAFAPHAGEQGVSFHCDVSNPHLPPGAVARAGAVDADLSVAIDTDDGVLSVDGRVDDFPAFEVYAAFNNGAPHPIATVFPRPGMSPFDLLGPALNPISGAVGW